MRSLGIETSGVIPLQRDIDTPDGLRTAKFERTQFAPNDSPEGYIQATRHLTPEYIYQPRYIHHANGCFQLAETILVADDLRAFERRYHNYLNITPEREGDLVRFRLPLGTTLTLTDLKHAPSLLPGTLFPPIPGIAAVGFRTRDLKGTKDRLKANAFTVIETGDRVLVPAEEASGIALMFGD